MRRKNKTRMQKCHHICLLCKYREQCKLERQQEKHSNTSHNFHNFINSRFTNVQ